ncbi:MAG TPA: hypothetical protein VNU93_09515, partial [Verrucomicrobiae bacterium]|nr:hypothetical protein [Verrucomicrobiae bacterium]
MKRFRDQEWQKKHSISLDINYMLTEHIGAAQGISQAELKDISPRVAIVLANMAQKRGAMEWRDLPYTQAGIVAEINAFANAAKGKFRN